MSKLQVFNLITLDGYFSGPNGDTSWHNHDLKEEKEFSGENASGGAILLFGRVTYEMMAKFWPSEAAQKLDAKTADGMNAAEKIVFSKTMKKADWQNTRVVSGDIVGEVRKLKESGKNMTIMGSGTIVSLFAQHGLIDEYQLMVVPVALGKGRSLFEGVDHRLNFKQTATRTFKSGNVLLTYQRS